MYGRDRYPEFFSLVEEMYEFLNKRNQDLPFLTEAHLQLRSLSESADLKRRLARKPKIKE